MNLSNPFYKFLHKLGSDSPNTILSVLTFNCLALATVRPTITLCNPDEPMQRKKYAALRESLSELIGILGAKVIGPAFFKKESKEIDKEVIRKVFSIGGIAGGNMMIPFFTTAAIGLLGLNAKKSHPKPDATALHDQDGALKIEKKRPQPPKPFSYLSQNTMTKPNPSQRSVNFNSTNFQTPYYQNNSTNPSLYSYRTVSL
jgi:hypothetical protein